ncbi:serine/threonine protein kinase [Nocardia yunnanensis]|uniref:non-specific serine/threonine protein kinase n=2 Tax=Nocardia yunnanensis TaxID=2382165 RepID=A0A386ZMQ1_9NOCA|nr:serine/threonine protein kinase [Nocardia yunnanensis]
MGSVYLAKHPRLPRMTALKLLNQEMFSDDEIRARFIREADLVARLDHPNIVTVYDRGDEGEQLWISMQFIDGVNASSISPGTLPPQRAVQIIAETAKALDYAHGLNILHRDVKPANILLARASSKTGSGERVYLTDFGIARLRDDTGHLTQTGTVTATLAYASPEQLTGANLDGRSDQYSLACTLFQLLTGAVPFEGTSPAAVIRGHLQQPPPPASPRRQALPPAIDAVLTRALAKRPADRFRSCVEFATAAERALQSPRPAVPPRPPTPAHPQPIVTPRPPTPVHPQPVIQKPPAPQPPTPTPRPLSGPTYTNPAPAYPTPQQHSVPQPSVPQHSVPQLSAPSFPNQSIPTPAYTHPTYQPRPTPPPTYPPAQKNSNTTGWLIAAIVTVLVIVIIVIAVIIKSSKSKADTPQHPDTVVTSALAIHQDPLGDKPFRITL